MSSMVLVAPPSRTSAKARAVHARNTILQSPAFPARPNVPETLFYTHGSALVLQTLLAIGRAV